MLHYIPISSWPTGTGGGQETFIWRTSSCARGRGTFSCVPQGTKNIIFQPRHGPRHVRGGAGNLYFNPNPWGRPRRGGGRRGRVRTLILLRNLSPPRLIVECCPAAALIDCHLPWWVAFKKTSFGRLATSGSQFSGMWRRSEACWNITIRLCHPFRISRS